MVTVVHDSTNVVAVTDDAESPAMAGIPGHEIMTTPAEPAAPYAVVPVPVLVPPPPPLPVFAAPAVGDTVP